MNGSNVLARSSLVFQSRIPIGKINALNKPEQNGLIRVSEIMIGKRIRIGLINPESIV